MEVVATPQRPAGRSARVRLDLAPEVAEALERRARRNDRYAFLEAARILRETLVRDGDLADHPDDERPE